MQEILHTFTHRKIFSEKRTSMSPLDFPSHPSHLSLLPLQTILIVTRESFHPILTPHCPWATPTYHCFIWSYNNNVSRFIRVSLHIIHIFVLVFTNISWIKKNKTFPSLVLEDQLPPPTILQGHKFFIISLVCAWLGADLWRQCDFFFSSLQRAFFFFFPS